MDYEVVIGLEIHAQLLTRTKLFCSCVARFGGEPNAHTCPVCLGLPGVLPVINREAVDFALRVAVATHCEMARYSQFARKNYFYPDLPKDYQISQYELPLATGGYMDINIGGEIRRIGIKRIHLEEDAGKLTHTGDFARARASFVDFNRCGVPLLEIVSEPDIRSPSEGVQFMRDLRSILRYLGVCDGNMEEGSLRCDANISLRPRGEVSLGVKTELKNMNSFKHIQRALEYEIRRQEGVLGEGGEVVQETRLWDSGRGITLSMRGKEQEQDYRYFPEPDLPPLVIEKGWVDEIERTLPELPEVKKERFIKQYGLPEYDAGVLTSSKSLADFFEHCKEIYPRAKTLSNWIMVELLRLLNDEGVEVEESRISPVHLVSLLEMIDKGVVSISMAKGVFEDCYRTGKLPREIVEERGLTQISDTEELKAIIEGVLGDNPALVEQYRGGKERLLSYFVGQVMKATRGKANPRLVGEILKKSLENRVESRE